MLDPPPKKRPPSALEARAMEGAPLAAPTSLPGRGPAAPSSSGPPRCNRVEEQNKTRLFCGCSRTGQNRTEKGAGGVFCRALAGTGAGPGCHLSIQPKVESPLSLTTQHYSLVLSHLPAPSAVSPDDQKARQDVRNCLGTLWNRQHLLTAKM